MQYIYYYKNAYIFERVRQSIAKHVYACIEFRALVLRIHVCEFFPSFSHVEFIPNTLFIRVYILNIKRRSPFFKSRI